MGTHVPAAQRGEEIDIRGGRVDRLAHRQPLSCSATNGEQLTSATARALRAFRELHAVAVDEGDATEIDAQRCRRHPGSARRTGSSSSTHGPTTRPASSSTGSRCRPSGRGASDILSTPLDKSKLRARRLSSRCWSGSPENIRYVQRCAGEGTLARHENPWGTTNGRGEAYETAGGRAPDPELLHPAAQGVGMHLEDLRGAPWVLR